MQQSIFLLSCFLPSHVAAITIKAIKKNGNNFCGLVSFDQYLNIPFFIFLIQTGTFKKYGRYLFLLPTLRGSLKGDKRLSRLHTLQELKLFKNSHWRVNTFRLIKGA